MLGCCEVKKRLHPPHLLYAICCQEGTAVSATDLTFVSLLCTQGHEIPCVRRSLNALCDVAVGDIATVLHPDAGLHARAQLGAGTGQVVAGARGVPIDRVCCRGVLLGGKWQRRMRNVWPTRTRYGEVGCLVGGFEEFFRCYIFCGCPTG